MARLSCRIFEHFHRSRSFTCRCLVVFLSARANGRDVCRSEGRSTPLALVLAPPPFAFWATSLTLRHARLLWGVPCGDGKRDPRAGLASPNHTANLSAPAKEINKTNEWEQSYSKIAILKEGQNVRIVNFSRCARCLLRKY